MHEYIEVRGQGAALGVTNPGKAVGAISNFENPPQPSLGLRAKPQARCRALLAVSPLVSCRRGITLLEVMIAVMVLGIGLIGVGALVSVGALQAQRASIDDSKAAAGRGWTRDDKVRGFCHAEAWMTAANASFMQTVSGVQAFPADSVGNQNNLQPVAIDPLMVGAFGNTVATFASDGNKLTMQRLTVSSVVSVAALQSCMSEDDMSFTQSTTSADVLPSGGYNAAGTKREYLGRFTWLATLVPAYGDLQPTETRNLMYMSVVVFNQRQLAIAPQSASPPTERACQVTAVSGSGYGGGDLTLSGSSANAVALRVGECLMLGWMQLDVPADANTGKPTAFSQTANYGKVARPMFRWYRILNAGPPVNSSGTWTRNVTVAGPDINLSSNFITPKSMFAFIYDGAVAVYERTVRLEGPSMWTN